MDQLVDVYKVMEEGVLFRTKLRKISYQEGKVFLSSTPLVKKFILVGDVVRLGYMNMLLPARVVGKNDNLIVNIFYAGEGKFGDRSKPRVPVEREFGFNVLINLGGVYVTFEPVDISEGGFSVVAFDTSLVSTMLGKTLNFKISGREELLGVAGTARLVGIVEDGQETKLAFETELGDASVTKIRLYVINTIKRLFSA
ncbi:MAG: hypothetical protein RMH93_01100 [Aquificaceae bacterium]|nr:hypothetical protein [Aquificaceae bacterium]